MTDSDIEPTEEPGSSYHEILQREIYTGLKELERPAGGLLTSGLSAGLDLGFSVLLMAVMLSLFDGSLPAVVKKILIANMYSVGFIFVIIGRSELFTEHTTLAVLPVLDGQSSLKKLGRLWGLVYGSNIAGAAIFALIMIAVAPALGIANVSAFEEIGLKLVKHDWWVILASAVLAGWLMGLLSWLLAASEETLARIFVVWLVTTSIGFAHLHHSIAGTIEVLAAVLASPEVGWADFGKFLFWTTLGNALGGVFFVALIKYGHVQQSAEEQK